MAKTGPLKAITALRVRNSRGRTRTCDPPVNSRLLYQLSYSGMQRQISSRVSETSTGAGGHRAARREVRGDHTQHDQASAEPLSHGQALPQDEPRRERGEQRLETEDERRPRRRHVALGAHLQDKAERARE